jgi:hypothetical protein
VEICASAPAPLVALVLQPDFPCIATLTIRRYNFKSKCPLPINSIRSGAWTPLESTGLSPFKTYLINVLRSPKPFKMPQFKRAPPICEIASTDWTVYFLTNSISPIDWGK